MAHRLRLGQRRLTTASRHLALAAVLALLAACGAEPTRPAPPRAPAPAPDFVPQPEFSRAEWSQVPGWSRDDVRDAFGAFRTGCAALRQRAPWQAACAEALAETRVLDTAAVRAFFERLFLPWQVSTTDPTGTRIDSGQITGYFEPVLQGSRHREGRFTIPVYGLPDDLVTVDLGDLYPSLKGERVRGRLVGKRVVPYADRAGIGRGEGPKGKELLWVDSAVDAFFLHVQGSGRVRLPNGETIRVAYADQNGHPYRSIGRVLVDQQELTVEQATAPGLRAWIAQHPDRADEILNANPSYVFFREEAITDPTRGPRGALGVPLTPGRSIAIDPRNLPLGAPVFVSTTAADGTALERLVMAQDTGGAIRGVVRADFFAGVGAEAGDRAGRMRASGRLWVIWPREAGAPLKP